MHPAGYGRSRDGGVRLAARHNRAVPLVRHLEGGNASPLRREKGKEGLSCAVLGSLQSLNKVSCQRRSQLGCGRFAECPLLVTLTPGFCPARTGTNTRDFCLLLVLPCVPPHRLCPSNQPEVAGMM